MSNVYTFLENLLNSKQVIPLFYLTGDVFVATEFGYLMDCYHPYTLTFQTKFFQETFGKAKYDDKDGEYLQHIYDTILEISYKAWCFNLYFENGNEMKYKIMEKRAPSLQKAMMEFNNLKYSELPRKLNEIKLLGAKTREQQMLKYLNEKGFIDNFTNIAPMSDPYARIAHKKAMIIAEMMSLDNYSRDAEVRLKRRLIYLMLFPFLLPQDLCVSFVDQPKSPFYTNTNFETFYESELVGKKNMSTRSEFDILSRADVGKNHLSLFYTKMNKFNSPEIHIKLIDYIRETSVTSTPTILPRIWNIYNFKEARELRADNNYASIPAPSQHTLDIPLAQEKLKDFRI